MRFEVNNLFSCWTESKAALEKTFQEGSHLYSSFHFSNSFNNIFDFLLIVSIVNDHIFDLEDILKTLCISIGSQLMILLGGGEISPPLRA